MSTLSVKKSRSSPSSSTTSSSEQVQNAVGRYLQKRRYSSNVGIGAGAGAEPYRTNTTTTTTNPSGGVLRGGGGVADPPPTHTVQQMALKEVLAAETSTNGAVEFSSASCEPVVLEQQYAKFKIWISESADEYKPELAQLLYPMFTHLYLELINNGQKLTAQKFHKRHQLTFMGNAEFASFIRLLAAINGPEDIVKSETVNTYQDSKYSVTLSNKTFIHLMSYIQNCETPILLHILRHKIDLKLSDPLAACSKTEAISRVKHDIKDHDNDNYYNQILRTSSSNSSAKKRGSSSSSSGGANNLADELRKLRETIEKVREGPMPCPSTCLYRICNDRCAVTSSAISENGKLMAAGNEDSSVVLYDLLPDVTPPSPMDDSHARIYLGSLEPSEPRIPDSSSSCRVLRAHCGPVYDVSFVPDSKYLLSVSEDTSMRIWDTGTGSNKAIYRGHSYPIWCLDVDRLGIHVVTGSMDRTAKLWNLEYTFPLRIYAGHEQDVDCVQFHPNCNYLATGSVDKSIRMWSHADAKMVRVFTGHKAGILALSFSPNGKLLASAGEDRRIRVWDLASSHQLKDLKGHTDTVYSLVWSADSSLLASGGFDGTVRIWDIKKASSNDTTTSASSSSSAPSPSTSTSAAAAAAVTAPELVATYTTQCANIIDLKYSSHNTLLATGTVLPETNPDI